MGDTPLFYRALHHLGKRVQRSSILVRRSSSRPASRPLANRPVVRPDPTPDRFALPRTGRSQDGGSGLMAKLGGSPFRGLAAGPGGVAQGRSALRRGSACPAASSLRSRRTRQVRQSRHRSSTARVARTGREQAAAPRSDGPRPARPGPGGSSGLRPGWPGDGGVRQASVGPRGPVGAPTGCRPWGPEMSSRAAPDGGAGRGRSVARPTRTGNRAPGVRAHPFPERRTARRRLAASPARPPALRSPPDRSVQSPLTSPSPTYVRSRQATVHIGSHLASKSTTIPLREAEA